MSTTFFPGETINAIMYVRHHAAVKSENNGEEYMIKQNSENVYDALISPEILSRIPAGKETIYVGKHAGNHPVPQEEINQILVREAEKGKRVLRLKGGDPFVFGRGGEELEILLGEGIPFEVVPGITSSVAVPAYAGIPVTHRDHTSSFHVITGHARKDGTLSIDFASLVKLNGTLVFLMSVSSMEKILNGLMEAGMDPGMPAAVLERGTTAKQRRVSATVGTLKEESEKAGIGTPAIIVVGKVCALAEDLRWAEERILGGRRFLLTRPRQNISTLAKRLRDLGAQVIEMPAIRTEAISPNPVLGAALERFSRRDGENTADFIGCVAFARQAEFAEKYLRQGTKVVLTGRIQTGSYTNRDGQKVYTTDVVAEDLEFAESKAAAGQNAGFQPQQNSNPFQAAPSPSAAAGDGFMNIPDGIDEELPFN